MIENRKCYFVVDVKYNLIKSTTKYFADVKKVTFEGSCSKTPFSYKHYNPQEVILGKTMKDHLPFAVAYWHTIKF